MADSDRSPSPTVGLRGFRAKGWMRYVWLVIALGNVWSCGAAAASRDWPMVPVCLFLAVASWWLSDLRVEVR